MRCPSCDKTYQALDDEQYAHDCPHCGSSDACFPDKSWKHSIYCAIEDGEPCTCKEPQ